MYRNIFLPEALAPVFPDGQSKRRLQQAMDNQEVLTGTVCRCDSRRDLHIRFGGYEGRIPREDCVHPAISGADRDIAILSLVGKRVSFLVTELHTDGGGKPYVIASRRGAQELAMGWLLEHGTPNTVVPAAVTHLEPFGAFVDLGAGIISMLPLENISVSRIRHPSERLQVGQKLWVAVTSVDRERCRFTITHKELLGTWLQNAADFAPGEVVTGIVRGIQEYGTFIELTPNLSGLADPTEELSPGDLVSVYIKSIQPERRKIKLQIVEALGPAACPAPIRYFITDGTVEDWDY